MSDVEPVDFDLEDVEIEDEDLDPAGEELDENDETLQVTVESPTEADAGQDDEVSNDAQSE